MRRVAGSNDGAAAMAQTPVAGTPVSGAAATAKPGQDVKMMLLPKFLGILPFDQANQGAQEAAAELQNPTPFDFVGPTAENSVAGQIEFMTNAPTGGYNVVMLSNNSGDQIVPAAVAAQAAGTKVVTWDSPIPTGEGESVFVAQVDFTETGQVMADMARDILGEDGGKFAILSASPDAANQNAWIAAMKTALEDPKYSKLELLEIVYGDDQSEKSYDQAQALISKYPDMKLIMAPDVGGHRRCGEGASGRRAVRPDQGLRVWACRRRCWSTRKNGCAPEFALWSFVDLGYLTYYVSYLLATGAIQGVEGETFTAGRLGEYDDHQGPHPTRRRRAARADGSVHASTTSTTSKQQQRDSLPLRVNRLRPIWPEAAPLPEPGAGQPRTFREAGQFGVGDVRDDGRPPGHRSETAIGTGDHPFAADDPRVPLDPLRHGLGVLDAVGTGVDDARDEHFVAGGSGISPNTAHSCS